MTIEEIKRKLSSAYYAQKKIESIDDQIKGLRAVAERITPAYKVDAGGGGGDGQKMANAIDKIVDLQGELHEEIKRLVASINKVKKIIEKLDDPRLELVLRERYVNYRSWPKVAVHTGYNERHVYKLHAEALEKLSKLL